MTRGRAAALLMQRAERVKVERPGGREAKEEEGGKSSLCSLSLGSGETRKQQAVVECRKGVRSWGQTREAVSAQASAGER